jgi:hypothetical protein
MNPKRYQKTVDITIRVPVELHERAKAVVAELNRLEETIVAPLTAGPVKASLSVLFLRGLVFQVNLWGHRLDRVPYNDAIDWRSWR